jgi:hypothetical protein
VNLKEVIPLFTATVFFVGAVYPKAIFLKIARAPHPQQLIARLCLVALGLLALWWYAMEA